MARMMRATLADSNHTHRNNRHPRTASTVGHDNNDASSPFGGGGGGGGGGGVPNANDANDDLRADDLFLPSAWDRAGAGRATNPTDSALVFSPHPCRHHGAGAAATTTTTTMTTKVGDGGVYSNNDSSHDGSNSNDMSQRHARKKKKNGLFKFLGGSGGSGISTGGDDAALGTHPAPTATTLLHHLPIPFAPPPSLLDLTEMAAASAAATTTTTATSGQPPHQQHQHHPHHQTKKLLLLNLEDVSILSSSVISGSHRTPYDGSKTTTTGSEGDQLSKDAQQVLGGLRKQRESREERKRAVLQQQQAQALATAASSSMHSSSHHKKGSLASKVSSGKSKSSKKNGIDPDAMVGTVLVVPCGPSTDGNSDDEADAEAEADAAAERATGCWFPGGNDPRAAALSMVDLELPASPSRSPPRKKKGGMPPSPEEFFPGSGHGRRPATDSAPALAATTTVPTVSGKPSSGSPKKPFVAPPPLMEDWSDEEDDEIEADRGGSVNLDCSYDSSFADACLGSMGLGNVPMLTPARQGKTEGAAAAVLRDYRSLLSDGKDGESRSNLMGDDSSSSPKDVRHLFSKDTQNLSPATAACEATTLDGPWKSSSVGLAAALEASKKREVEECKQEEEDAPVSPQQVLNNDSSPMSPSSTHSSLPPPPPTLLRALTSWGPFTFPSTRSLEAQFRQPDIAVAPNVRLPVRGVKETMAALRRVDAQPSYFATTKCWTCETYLCCLRDAEFVLCPSCRVVSPLDVVTQGDVYQDENQSVFHSHGASKNGVALGFTDSEWLQWRQQISLFEDGC